MYLEYEKEKTIIDVFVRNENSIFEGISALKKGMSCL